MHRGGAGVSPLEVALQSRALEVIKLLKFWGTERRQTEMSKLVVMGSSEDSVNGEYFPTSPGIIPPGFEEVRDRELSSLLILH